MERIPRSGEIYQHFKGNLYRIVTLAEHSETGEQLVIYQALYGDFRVYARPLNLFISKVDREKYPQAQAEYRFTLVPAAEVIQPEVQPVNDLPHTAAKEDEELKQPASTVPEEEEFVLDPMLAAFLDADSYERKLEIFDSLQGKADEAMLNTIAVSLDLELPEGDLEEQYMELKNCLLTLERYECNRLR